MFGMTGLKAGKSVIVSTHRCHVYVQIWKALWLSKVILEICKKDGLDNSLNTLYAISCGILRCVREYAPKVNFFCHSQIMFDGFRKP